MSIVSPGKDGMQIHLMWYYGSSGNWKMIFEVMLGWLCWNLPSWKHSGKVEMMSFGNVKNGNDLPAHQVQVTLNPLDESSMEWTYNFFMFISLCCKASVFGFFELARPFFSWVHPTTTLGNAGVSRSAIAPCWRSMPDGWIEWWRLGARWKSLESHSIHVWSLGGGNSNVWNMFTPKFENILTHIFSLNTSGIYIYICLHLSYFKPHVGKFIPYINDMGILLAFHLQGSFPLNHDDGWLW